MKRIVELITALIPFLEPYPLWVKAFFSFWVILSALLFLALVLAPRAEKSVRELEPPFDADVKTALLGRGQWWVTYRSSHGDTVSPVDALLFLQIVNRQNAPSSIEEYTVEVEYPEKNWTRLRRITPLGSAFWLTDPGDLRTGRECDFTANALDLVLLSKELQAGETVEGWAFYEAPDALTIPPGSKTRYRISVRDSKKVKASIATGLQIVKSEFSSGDEIPRAWFRATGRRADLSSYHLKAYSDPVTSPRP